MNYGMGAAPSVAGVAILPATGNNTILFAIAVGLIAVGMVVFVTSLILARKSRATNEG